jgi:hypothetical protein
MFNVFWLCGQAVFNSAHKSVGKIALYTHNPHKNFIQLFLKSCTQFCARICTLVYTHIFMFFTSVRGEFYPLYTGPTITTTLNN